MVYAAHLVRSDPARYVLVRVDGDDPALQLAGLNDVHLVVDAVRDPAAVGRQRRLVANVESADASHVGWEGGE